MAPLIPLAEAGRMNRRVRLPGRQNKNLHEVLATRIDERRDVLPAENIQAANDQGKTLVRNILHRRNKSELAVEPRLHGVIVRGSNVGEMPRLQRANMGVNDLGGSEGGASCAIPGGTQPGKPGNRSDEQNGGGNGKPTPGGNANGIRGSSCGIKSGTELLAKTNGSAFVKAAALKRRAQRFLRPKGGSAFAAGLEVALKFRGARGVQLPIQIAVEDRASEITTHGRPPEENA